MVQLMQEIFNALFNNEGKFEITCFTTEWSVSSWILWIWSTMCSFRSPKFVTQSQYTVLFKYHQSHKLQRLKSRDRVDQAVGKLRLIIRYLPSVFRSNLLTYVPMCGVAPFCTNKLLSRYWHCWNDVIEQQNFVAIGNRQCR